MTWREARKQLQSLNDRKAPWLSHDDNEALEIAIERLLEVEDLEGDDDP
jgi:hypothetical protein